MKPNLSKAFDHSYPNLDLSAISKPNKLRLERSITCYIDTYLVNCNEITVKEEIIELITLAIFLKLSADFVDELKNKLF
jgi:hypothetical protein